MKKQVETHRRHCVAVPVPPEPKSVLMEAEGLINGDRMKVYHHPMEDFSRTALIWSAIFGHEVTAEQVALCMVGVKISRLIATPGHRDSIVDGSGYFGCLAKVRNKRTNGEEKE